MCLIPYWNSCAIWSEFFFGSMFYKLVRLVHLFHLYSDLPNTNGWGKWFYIMILSWISFMLDFRLTETSFVILVIIYIEIFLEWLQVESIWFITNSFPINDWQTRDSGTDYIKQLGNFLTTFPHIDTHLSKFLFQIFGVFFGLYQFKKMFSL